MKDSLKQELKLKLKALNLAVEANKNNGHPNNVLSDAQRYYKWLVNNFQ